MGDASRWLELIQGVLNKTETFYNEKQYEEIAQCYAEDIRLFPPGSPEAKGREALIKAHKEVKDNCGSKCKISDVEVLQKTDDWALAKHNFVISTDEGRQLFHAKMIHTWRFKDGVPEITFTMWNFDDTVQI